MASRGSPEETARVVLRLLGLNESDRRVFLSYRRSDGSELAHQLRYALIDAGWDVFLDRYNVPPATVFQDRLDRDLADKGFVLLLETPDASNSPWVEHEVAFAYRRKLGLMSLALPETPKSKLFPAVLPELRCRLQSGDLEATPGGLRLLPDALHSVLGAIDHRHAAAYQQRREILMEETTRELARRGYAVTPIGHWSLLASDGVRDEIVYATPRAPEPQDLLTVDRLRAQARRRGRTARGWVVHSLEDIDLDRARLLGWLCKRRVVGPSPVMLLGGRLSR